MTVIPDEQVTSILVGQVCQRIYEYGFCFVYDGIKGEYAPNGIVLELQDGRVINCQRRSYADLIFTFSSLEAEKNYELENFIKEKIILFESYGDICRTIFSIERDKDLQEYDEVKVIVGNVAIRLYIAADELEIQRSFLG